MKRIDFFQRGIRARAFVGWSKYKDIGIGGAINNSHVNFVTNFFQAWTENYPPGHPKAGLPRGLKDALELGARFGNPNAPIWDGFSGLDIFGADDLMWQDSIP